MRILKHENTITFSCAFSGYKKIDPFADTETRHGAASYDAQKCYKKIDPFADTETAPCAWGCCRPLCYKKIDPFADTETRIAGAQSGPPKSYKKIDPFADTETLSLVLYRLQRLRLQKNRSVCGYWNTNTGCDNSNAWAATKKSIRLRILKRLIKRVPRISTDATKKSIRLRILKRNIAYAARHNQARYKKIDPFADTETIYSSSAIRFRSQATKKSIRLRILKRHSKSLKAWRRYGYKKIDPFADTETCVFTVFLGFV